LNYPLYEQNINYLLNLPKKEKYNKTIKYAVSNIDGQEIFLTQFLFAKQRGYIKDLKGHSEIEIGYYKLLPFLFWYIEEIHLDSKSGRKAYIISDNDGRKIYHIVDVDGSLLSIYIVRDKEHKRFLKKAKEVIIPYPNGEAPVSPILSPAWAAFWRHSEMIELLYQKLYKKPIYLFSISTHKRAININSLSITFFKPKIDFSEYDYLIITSKQVSKGLVEYGLDEYKKALCVSKQSALAYEKIGGEVLEVGGGYGDNLVDIIKRYPKNTKWLYLRAKVVASDFVSTCRDDGYSIDEVVFYESECSKEILTCSVEDGAVLIFTSPSSVKCFLKNHTIKPTHKVIVIGNTTAKALPDGVEFVVSEKTTIQSCIDSV